MSRGWFGNKVKHKLASKGIKTVNKFVNPEKKKPKELVIWEDVDIDDINKNDVLIMIDVDETALKEQLNWDDELINTYKTFIKSLEEKTDKRIHGVTWSDTWIEDWNGKEGGWEIEAWADDYSCGKVYKGLINKIKKLKPTGRIVVFGAMYNDCVGKTAKDLNNYFNNVVLWKNYSVGEEYGTYFYEG